MPIALFPLTIVNYQFSIKSNCHSSHSYHHHPPQKLSFAVSHLPMVRFEHVRSFFDSTQSQESKFDIASHNRTRQCALGPILRPPLYLWCPWSNLDMLHHFLHLQNLRNPNLISLPLPTSPSHFPLPLPPPSPSSLSSLPSFPPLSLSTSLLLPLSSLSTSPRPCHNCNFNWFF